MELDNVSQNAFLTIYNLYEQRVKQMKNISGQSVILHRDGLPCGLFFVHLQSEEKIIGTGKLVIGD